jgi:hypothetical protein
MTMRPVPGTLLSASTKEAEMLISGEMNAAINEQIGYEFAAMLQSVAIATYFDGEELPMLVGHFYRQAEEERAHALRFVTYVVDAGGAVQRSLDRELTVPKQINVGVGQGSMGKEFPWHSRS